MSGRFGAVVTAMVTPFHQDHTLDLDGAQQLAAYLLDSGSDALVVAGSTGEAPTLTGREKRDLYGAVVDAAGGKGKVICGAGTYSTAETLEFTSAAEEAGADGLLVVTPYYNKPPQRGLVAHFEAVAEQTELPIIAYNIPGRTATRIEHETLLALAEIPNIVAVKDSTGDFQGISKLIDQAPADFEVYCGDDWAAFGYMCLGAKGVVSVASHLVGSRIGQMIDLIETGDVPGGPQDPSGTLAAVQHAVHHLEPDPDQGGPRDPRPAGRTAQVAPGSRNRPGALAGPNGPAGRGSPLVLKWFPDPPGGWLPKERSCIVRGCLPTEHLVRDTAPLVWSVSRLWSSRSPWSPPQPQPTGFACSRGRLPAPHPLPERPPTRRRRRAAATPLLVAPRTSCSPPARSRSRSAVRRSSPWRSRSSTAPTWTSTSTVAPTGDRSSSCGRSSSAVRGKASTTVRDLKYDTRFRADWAGDLVNPAAEDTALARVHSKCIGKLLRFQRRKGNLRLYKEGKPVFFLVKVSPNHDNDPIAIRLQAFVRGHWRNLDVFRGRLNLDSLAGVKLGTRGAPTGVRFRFRGEFGGRYGNLPDNSPWANFAIFN